MVKLSEKQKEVAIKTASYLKENGYAVISGEGGTGKTTISKVVVEDYLKIPEKNVLALAPTAAAAKRLQSQWKKTSTIQKGIYNNQKAYDEKNNSFIYIKNKKDESELDDYDLLLIDEASMVDYSTFLDIQSFEKPMLFLGDKAQLPPVKKQYMDEEKTVLFNVMDYTTGELTENFRQSNDSGILKICKTLRKQEKTQLKSNKDVLFLQPEKLTQKHLLKADQIIVSTNRWKDEINKWISKEKGNYSSVPIEGEKIVFTENNYDIKSDEGYSVVNSLLGTIERIGNIKRKDIGGKTAIVAKATISTEFGSFKDIWVDIRPFIDGNPSSLIEIKSKEKGRHFLYEDMCRIEYGWAITSWKSQGQEWNKVLYIQGDYPRIKEESWQEAYTACSRAKEKMIVVPRLSSKGYMWQI